MEAATKFQLPHGWYAGLHPQIKAMEPVQPAALSREKTSAPPLGFHMCLEGSWPSASRREEFQPHDSADLIST